MHLSPAAAAPPAFHPRAVLFAAAMGPAIRRSLNLGMVAAVAVAAVLAFVLPRGVPWPLNDLATVALGVLAGLAVAVVVLPRKQRIAYEAFSWLGRREIDRFRARTASDVPTDPRAAVRWLEANPRAPATALARVEMLAMLGRTDEARDELRLLPPPASEVERVEHAALDGLVAFIAGGPARSDALDELARSLDPRSGPGLEVAVVEALGASRGRLDARDPGWPEPLVSVRPRLGRDATMVTVRDTWSRMALMFALVALVAGWLTGAGRALLGM